MLSLHPPVQKLPCLLVVEFRNHLVEEVDQVSAGPGAGGAQRADAGLEVLELVLLEEGRVRTRVVPGSARRSG
jgi:hypothetical protein